MVETERNMRGEHLVVQSLEVLEDFSGKAARVIEAKIGNVRETLVSVASRADKFYQDAAADGIITPEEKKSLKRDFVALRRTYLSILQQAEIKGLSDDPRITGLTIVYNALYNYLNTTIKVFDDMSSNTVITSSDDMNGYYDDYYDAQMFAQAVLTESALAYVRVLSSLSDTGESGELGYYRGLLYRYDSPGGWQTVSSGDYMGVVSSATDLMESQEGSFFLSGASFSGFYHMGADVGAIVTDNDDYISVPYSIPVAGEIWVCVKGMWREVDDRNDWRYVLATNDLIAMGKPISPRLEGYVRDLAESVTRDVAGGTYLGPKIADPGSPSPGDFYLYVGNTTAARKNGSIYKYERTAISYAWTELSAADPMSYRNYMDALSDMLREDSQSLETGRFSVVFARSLAAMSAMIETLMTQTLILKSGGVFKSEIFNEYTGFQLKADGMFECVNGKFNGNIDSGPLLLEKMNPGLVTVTASAGSTFKDLWSALSQQGLLNRTITATVVYGASSYSSVLFRLELAVEEQKYFRYHTVDYEAGLYKNQLDIYLCTTTFKHYQINGVDLGVDTVNTAVLDGTSSSWESQSKNDPLPPTGETLATLASNFSLSTNAEAWKMILRNIPSGYSPDYPSGTIYRIDNQLCIK